MHAGHLMFAGRLDVHYGTLNNPLQADTGSGLTNILRKECNMFLYEAVKFISKPVDVHVQAFQNFF